MKTNDQRRPKRDAREKTVAMYVLYGSGRVFVDLFKQVFDVALDTLVVH